MKTDNNGVLLEAPKENDYIAWIEGQYVFIDTWSHLDDNVKQLLEIGLIFIDYDSAKDHLKLLKFHTAVRRLRLEGIEIPRDIKKVFKAPKKYNLSDSLVSEYKEFYNG